MIMDSAPFVRDPLIRAVVAEFRRRFSPRGQITWVTEAGSRPAFVSDSACAGNATAALAASALPNVGIEESDSGRLILVDVATVRGPIDERRCKMLARKLGRAGLELIFVTAYRGRSDLAILPQPPWGTIAWFADEPDHLIAFNGGALRDPR